MARTGSCQPKAGLFDGRASFFVPLILQEGCGGNKQHADHCKGEQDRQDAWKKGACR